MEKNYKKLCPFKGWTLENFPFIEADFDAITNYELLCKIVEYLNKTSSQFNDMIDNINYLNNWFNNLDVQDEINNKLDEMVESGELQEIIASYLNANALWCFDNVNSMKEATNLIDGSYAKTMGYYNVGDGGEANYIISDDELIPDNGSIIALNNGLYAKLVYNESVNPQQFGAKGDGVTDDTTYINKCINFVNNLALQNKELPTITFNNKYYVTDTITLPPYIKYNLNGNVTFIGNLTDNKAIIKIGYTSYSRPELDNSETWTQGNFFDGNRLLLQGVDGTNKAPVGLEIGDVTDLGKKYSVARTKFSNITINYCSIGIKINPIHFYLNNFDNIKMYYNDTNIQYGSNNFSATDSGENISFTNCLFGTSYESAINLYSNSEMSFINCSFDFNHLGIIQINSASPRLNINNCHIEGTEIDTTQNCYGYIWDNTNSSNPKINISNCVIAETRKVAPLVKFSNISSFECYLNDLTITYSAENWETEIINPENKYLIVTNNDQTTHIILGGYINKQFQQTYKGNIINSDNNFENDTSVLNTDYWGVQSISHYNTPSITAINSINYLTLEPSDASGNASVYLNRLEYLPVRFSWYYYVNLNYIINRINTSSTSSPSKIRFYVHAKFYDENKDQIGTLSKDVNLDVTDRTNGELYKLRNCLIINTPNDSRVRYMTLSYQFYTTDISNLSKLYISNITAESL